MKTVYLDYKNPVQTRLSSWLLLLSGALMLGVMLLVFLHLQTRNAELKNRLAAHTSPATVPVTIENPQRQKESEAVRKAIQDIVVPWPSLWKALEAASIEGVRMLAFGPNAKTRMVRLSLVAVNHAEMWRYMQNLNQQQALQDVRLISSEATDVGGQHAVAFLVEASWPI